MPYNRLMPEAHHDIIEFARDALLAALPELWAIYVHGSFARGDQRPDSDLDIAILPPPDQQPPNLPDIAGRIAERIGREVDLVDLRRVGDVLRIQVLAHGITVYNARPDEVLAWEGQAMTRYQHYRREVADLLDDFNRTGVGYAGRTP